LKTLFIGRPPELGGVHFQIEDVVCADNELCYEIGGCLGTGGNAVVYECIDSINGEELAIKFQLKHEEARIKRFYQESALLRNLRHQHIIKCFANGQVLAKKYEVVWNGKMTWRLSASIKIPFIVMEKAISTLGENLRECEHPPEFYIAQFKGLSLALHELHSQGIHRDIKPNNILVIGDRWVISDFGLCRLFGDDYQPLTLDHERIGPRNWMSPELEIQANGGSNNITKASDIYQLANVFWKVVNGSKLELEEEPLIENWRGPNKLFEPIANALNINPNARPQNALEFHNQIESAMLS